VRDIYIDIHRNTIIFIPYGIENRCIMKNEEIQYGIVQNAKELGKLVRAHRKSRGVPLEKISGLANLGIRFLSEFERGKETAEIGKVLKTLNTLGLEVIVRPRKVNVRSSINIPLSFEATATVKKSASKKS